MSAVAQAVCSDMVPGSCSPFGRSTKPWDCIANNTNVSSGSISLSVLIGYPNGPSRANSREQLALSTGDEGVSCHLEVLADRVGSLGDHAELFEAPDNVLGYG